MTQTENLNVVGFDPMPTPEEIKQRAPLTDAATQTVFFGTDADNAPRQPTPDDPRLATRHSCAVVAVDARTGGEKWVTQLNADDVWHYGMAGYDPKTGFPIKPRVNIRNMQ